MRYNLIRSYYGGSENHKFDIPEGVKFFYYPGEVGHCLYHGCEHYYTVVNKDTYKEWLESIHFGIIEFIGPWAVVTLENVQKTYELPLITRREWFKQNGINFEDLTLAIYDGDFELLRAYKIQEFITPWTIRVTTVTLKEAFGSREYYSINKSIVEWMQIEPDPLSDRHDHLRVYEGQEAAVLWNSMIHTAMQHFSFDESKVQEDYDFNQVQKKVLAEIGVSSLSELQDLLKGKLNNIKPK